MLSGRPQSGSFEESKHSTRYLHQMLKMTVDTIGYVKDKIMGSASQSLSQNDFKRDEPKSQPSLASKKEAKSKNSSTYLHPVLIVLNALATTATFAALVTTPCSRHAETYLDFLTHLCTTLQLSGLTDDKVLPALLNLLREGQIIYGSYQGSFFSEGINKADALFHLTNLCAQVYDATAPRPTSRGSS